MSLTLTFLHLKLKELKCGEEWLCLHVLGTHKLRRVCGRLPAQDGLTGTPNAPLGQSTAHGVLQLSSVGSTGSQNPEINGCQ